jgi:hypothetical protein
MKIPDRETAERVTWMTEMLLSHGGHALPVGLRAALREYKSAFLAECASQKWARTGSATRYGRLADLIGQQITDGQWKPGQRMPSVNYLAALHAEKPDTVKHAFYVLAVRGQLAFESGSHYVLPHGITD